MAPYLMHIRTSLRLTFRDKTVVVSNYLFPLIFFFIFAQLFHADRGGAILQVATMSLCIGILGSGFFGAGMRAVSDREQNILRRFKVAPITPGPILASGLVTGLVHYLPVVILVLAISHSFYGMPWPERPLSLLVFVAIAMTAFRAMGMIVASVVNSLQESQIIVQLLYFPMLFLSGTTIPLTVLPAWVQTVAQFLPATYLFSGMEAIMGGRDGLAEEWVAVFALLLTTALGTFISMKLFRWEKGEKVRASAKLWLAGVMAPFVVLGVYQAHTHENVTKARILARDQRRDRTLLIRDARVITGYGKVIPSGAVLVKHGKIAAVYTGPAPNAKSLNAEVLEAAGKTLLPGLIDAYVHLVGPGGVFPSASDYNPPAYIPRELAAYLYCGVTAVASDGAPEILSEIQKQVNSGERLGAELLLASPVFTAAGGLGSMTGSLKNLPRPAAAQLAQWSRIPKTPEEARAQVGELEKLGVSEIRAILDAGAAGVLFNRMDVSILQSIARQAHADRLPFAVQTGNPSDIADALTAGANEIERGSFRAEIPAELFSRMKQENTTFVPALLAAESLRAQAEGSAAPMERSLVEQVGPAALLRATKGFLQSPEGANRRQQLAQASLDPAIATQNVARAYRQGVTLVAGSEAGDMLVIHGPAIQRELELWVAAGIPPQAAIEAATFNAARFLRLSGRIGSIQQDRDADLLLVDGDPLTDISALERISAVIFKGERIDRLGLFGQD